MSRWRPSTAATRLSVGISATCVHFERIRAFNAVNERLGHPRIEIVSPLAVIQYDDEDL
jgi:hypothetical protein